MPIKPENKALYPKDWPEIRERILKRAGHRCEHPGCTARNYSVGFWALENGIYRWSSYWAQTDAQHNYANARELAAEMYWNAGQEGKKPVVIVLTIAHLDHQPENCADDNLAAMCQRHHLAYDHEHHQRNAQATRRAKAGTLELFA